MVAILFIEAEKSCAILVEGIYGEHLCENILNFGPVFQGRCRKFSIFSSFILFI